MSHVDVIIPVYDGYQETVACLRSVLRTVDSSWARIIVINDCAPDQAITEFLRQSELGSPQLIVLENEKNMGFVASVNRGMAYDIHRDVVLLNSDVEVAGDWLHRLREAAYYHENVASVTPFSNNATICSFPNICEDNKLPFDLSLEEIDFQFAAEFTVADAYQVPTGVGCCMYLRRDCLNQIGLFDAEAFGRGYGEENDWSQRAARIGWQNLHLANCFVYHKGGVSFGAEQSSRLAVALDILDKKHPRFHAEVQHFIAKDPAREARVRGWLRLFAVQNKPKILMISHKLSGGVQQHIEELASTFRDQALFLFMVPDKDGETVRLSCFDDECLNDGLFFQIEAEYEKLLQLLSGIGIGRIHIHHTMGLPTRLWGLAEHLGCEYDLTVHDYYMVNGNPTLTDKEGRYVSEDIPVFDELCAGHRPLPEGVNADLWRSNHRPLVEGAARVIFPSLDCSNRFRRFFDVYRGIVAWHADYTDSAPNPVRKLQFSAGRPFRVLVLGALSREKGADVLENVAAVLAGENIEFHLLGYAYRRLGCGVISHDPYDNKNVQTLIEGVNPDVIWFPALWPETYSYTLSIALHSNLPIVVPNIGAFVERVQGRPQTSVVDWRSSTTQWRVFWMNILREHILPGITDNLDVNCQLVSHDFYTAEYIQAVAIKAATPDSDIFQRLSLNLYVHSLKLSRPERLLERIWRFSRRPVIARLISVVPFKVQRSIKRYLSHRPMHDIVGK